MLRKDVGKVGGEQAAQAEARQGSREAAKEAGDGWRLLRLVVVDVPLALHYEHLPAIHGAREGRQQGRSTRRGEEGCDTQVRGRVSEIREERGHREEKKREVAADTL